MAVGLGGYALTGGTLTLVGWGLDIRRLTDWGNSGISQMPNNALAISLSGLSLVLVAMGKHRAGAVFAAFAGLIGAATLSQYFTGIDLGIDRILIFRDWGQFGTVVPGRMGPPSSTSLTIFGLATILSTYPPMRRIAVIGGLTVVGIAMFSIVGYLLGASMLYTIPKFTTIAFQTATMLLSLGVGLLLCLPERQPMRTLLGNDAASFLVRRALPIVILLPAILGWLFNRGQQAGLVDSAYAIALLVVGLIFLLSALLWWLAAAVRGQEMAMRQSEERLRSILGSITDAFMTFDANWKFVFLNEQAESRLGKRRSDLLGHNVWEVLPEMIETEAYRHLQCSKSERTHVEYEFYNPVRQRWFADRAYPTAEGGLAVYSRDITNRKQSEEALKVSEREQRAMANLLRQQATELSEADRRKDEFLAILAHELRNPLAPIRNGLQILKLCKDDPDAAEQSRNMMERQLTQMVRLIDDLMDVSRITRGKIELRRQQVELTQIVHQALETSRPLIEANDHSLTVSTPPFSILLQADGTRLSQVFSNLFNNAAKYCKPGGQISLTVEIQGCDAVVTVKDSGIGIPSHMLPKVFNLFTQVNRSLEQSQGGLGIGLSLVKRLVEMHAGSVTARSDGDGKGSEFVVRLPLASQKAPSLLQPVELTESCASPDHPQTKLSSDRRRVLVADDNVDAATTLQILLDVMGNDVRIANDGVQAISIAADFRPHVVLLDIGMPGMNGYEACRRIREEPWAIDTVLIALTGWGQDDDRQKSRAAGFHHHLIKPVDPTVLMECIST